MDDIGLILSKSNLEVGSGYGSVWLEMSRRWWDARPTKLMGLTIEAGDAPSATWGAILNSKIQMATR